MPNYAVFSSDEEEHQFFIDFVSADSADAALEIVKSGRCYAEVYDALAPADLRSLADQLEAVDKEFPKTGRELAFELGEHFEQDEDDIPTEPDTLANLGLCEADFR